MGPILGDGSADEGGARLGRDTYLRRAHGWSKLLCDVTNPQTKLWYNIELRRQQTPELNPPSTTCKGKRPGKKHCKMSDSQKAAKSFNARRQIARQNVDKLGIKWEELPQVPFWAPLFGTTYNAWKFEVADVVVNTSMLLGRGLTPDERDIIAYLSAKKAATTAYEPPLSLAAALYMERRGRATFKFPFWTPKATSFDPSFFPGKRVPMIQGPNALLVWNATRFGCYAFAAHFIAGIFFASYTTSVQTAAILRDPRLGDLRRGFADRRNGKRSPNEVGQPWQTPEDPSMRDAETPYGDESYTDRSEPAKPDTSVDRVRGGGDGGDETHGSYSRTRGGYPPVPKPADAQTAPAPSDGFTEGSFFEDDASPVASAARTGNPSSSSSGSTWERLRKQAQTSDPAGQDSSAPRQRAYGQNTEQYTYSQADEDRATAKNQAQREFDAMLEKERQGEADSRNRKW